MRIVRAAAGLACLAVLAAGCSGGSRAGTGAAPAAPTSEPSTAAPTTGPPPTPPASTAVPAPAPTKTSPAIGGSRCHTADLHLALGPVDGAAGHRNGLVELVNASGRRCVIQGFGGLAFLDAGRHALPIGITRDGPAPVPSLLAGRGAAASKPIQWTVLPTGPDADPASCPTPAYVAVIPPDETVPLSVRWPFGVVCGDRISGKAYGVAE
jgi:hypothetical protein